MEPIVELAERLGAPVITTFKAKGQIPESNPLAAGVLGRSGTPVASWFMNESEEQRAGEWDVWQTSLHNPEVLADPELI